MIVVAPGSHLDSFLELPFLELIDTWGRSEIFRLPLHQAAEIRDVL